jgi:hypothetical protein
MFEQVKQIFVSQLTTNLSVHNPKIVTKLSEIRIGSGIRNAESLPLVRSRGQNRTKSRLRIHKIGPNAKNWKSHKNWYSTSRYAIVGWSLQIE